ncbi:MAG: dolichol kinase [Acidilobaceae archaeon]
MPPLIPENLVAEALITAVLAVYVLSVIALTKPLYDVLVSRNMTPIRAKYFNRKIIHIAAGGVVALLVPFIYSTPLLPFLASLAITALLASARRFRLLDWFQVPDNHYEVNFTVMWGLSILVLWLALGSPYLAVLPALYMSFGDGVTGIVRNIVVKTRSKHWSGNLAMALVSVPLGFLYGGLVGVVSAIVASVVERFEFNPVDDNVLVPLSSMAVILVLAPALVM